MDHDIVEKIPFAIALKNSPRQPNINHLRNLNSYMLFASAAASCKEAICTEIRANRHVPCPLLLKPPSKKIRFRRSSGRDTSPDPCVGLLCIYPKKEAFYNMEVFFHRSQTFPLDHTTQRILEDKSVLGKKKEIVEAIKPKDTTSGMTSPYVRE